MFKTKNIVFMCAVSLVLWNASFYSLYAQPYDESKEPIFDDVFIQEIVQPTGSQSIDEHLIVLAREGNVNFIADVTSIAENESTEAFPATKMAQLELWEPKLHMALLDLTQAKQLSMLRYNANTFLFWDEPTDNVIIERAKSIVNQPLLSDEDEYSSVLNMFSYIKMNNLIKTEDLLSKKQVDIALSDQNLQHQKHVQQIIQKLVADHNYFQRAWFDETFWKNAVMRIVPAKETGHVLEVAGFYRRQVVGARLNGLQGK